MALISERDNRLISTLHQLALLLASTPDLDGMIEPVFRLITSHFDATGAALTSFDETAGTQTVVKSFGALAGLEAQSDASPALAHVMERRQALLAPDADWARREEFRRDPGSLAGVQAGRLVYVPLAVGESVRAVLSLVRGEGNPPFVEHDLPLLTLVADYLAMALENNRRIQSIHELTITDDTTGLFNARHFKSMLESEIYRSARYDYEFSLVFVDLDFFKRVNDRFGHVVGSKLLAAVSRLIKKELRLIDSAFRYGGDEFLLLLPQTSKQNALIVVRRLREALNATEFQAVDSGVLRVTASYGVASFPADGTTPQDILRASDEAMYRVKTASRDGIALAGEEGLA